MKKLATMLLSTALLSTAAEAQNTSPADAPAPEGTDEAALAPVEAPAASEAPEAPVAEAAPATPAAKAESSLAIEEIVVTARKRAESIQEVPVAVTALSGDMLEKNAVLTIADVGKFAPNVALAGATVNPASVVAYIRGVGNRATTPQGDSPIATSIDGVYLSQVSGALVDVFDMQSVEVLRGPQGTLEGRNSPGGAINLTTRRPTGEYAANAEVGMGSFGRRSTRTAVEAPLVEGKLAGRLSIGTNNFDGQVNNTYTGQDAGGSQSSMVRAGLLFTPTENIDAYFTADYSKLKYGPTGLRYVGTDQSYPRQASPVACTVFGYCTPDPEYTTRSNLNSNSTVKLGGVAANISWNLGGVNLVSVSGYRKVDDDQTIDVDGLPINLVHTFDHRIVSTQASQEFRLSNEKGGGYDLDGRLNWVFGVFYIQAKYDSAQPLDITALGIPVTTSYQHQTLDSYAGFAHADYKLTDRWSISAGARQTEDKKKGGGIAGAAPDRPVEFDVDFSNFSFEAGTEFRFTPEALGYFRYAQGYRAGGVGEINNPDRINVFKPETVDSYEVGLKTEWFDRRMIANLAVFYSDYQDLQRDTVQSDGSGGIAQGVQNAASATIQGVELETQFRATQALSFRAAVGYLDAKYKDFVADIGTGVVEDNSDLALPFTPKWTINGSLDYDVMIGEKGIVTLTPDVEYKSKANLSPLDTPVSDQKAYSLVNFSATFNAASGAWGAGAYARNIFDKHYIIGAEPTGGLTAFQLEGLQRNFGIRVFAHF